MTETMVELGDVQKLYLELIKKSSFNNFDGEVVVEKLCERKDLWKSVIMTQCSGLGITLRDLSGDHNNVDSLVVLTNKDCLNEFLEFVEEAFNADEKTVCEGNAATQYLGGGEGVVVEFWWD